MPQELLRDVLRTDDAAGRSRRRWLFPVSMAVHAAGALAYLIIPLAAEATLPTPAPLFVNRRWVMPVTPPSETPAVVKRPEATPSLSHSAAPTEAPRAIVPEVPAVAEIPAIGGIDGPPGVSVGVPDASELETRGQTSCPWPTRQSIAAAQGWRLDPRAETNRGLPPVYPRCDQREGRRRSAAGGTHRRAGSGGGVRMLRSVPLSTPRRWTPFARGGIRPHCWWRSCLALMTVKVTFSLQR
jgi:hypothetical protein